MTSALRAQPANTWCVAKLIMHWQPARNSHFQLAAMTKRTFLQPAVCDGDAGLIRGAFTLAEEVAGHEWGHAYGAFYGREVQDTCNTHNVSCHPTIYRHHTVLLMGRKVAGMTCRCQIISWP